jgi:hypothetical protein
MKSCIFCVVRLKSTISDKHVASLPLATCSHTGFLLGLFSNPEDGGNMFLQIVG